MDSKTSRTEAQQANTATALRQEPHERFDQTRSYQENCSIYDAAVLSSGKFKHMVGPVPQNEIGLSIFGDTRVSIRSDWPMAESCQLYHVKGQLTHANFTPSSGRALCAKQ